VSQKRKENTASRFQYVTIDLVVKWEYHAYFAYYFVMFLHRKRVVFVPLMNVMVFDVVFIIYEMKE
jgi:hypothetical protein